MAAFRTRRWLTTALSILSPIVVILLWEWAVTAHVLDPRFYPKPSGIVAALGNLAATGDLWSNLGVSLARIALGFLAGAVPAVILGLLMGISRPVRAVLQPLALALNPIPKILIIPFIALLLLRYGEWSRIAGLAFGIFFFMLLDVSAAVQRIEPRYFEVARSFGANRWTVFLTVALPASLPSILNTIKLGLAYTLTLVIGVEIFLGVNNGIGYLTWNAGELYELDQYGAGIVLFALLGWAFSVIVDALTPTIIPWLPRATSAQQSPLRQQISIWWRAARPWSFSASTIPVALGGIIAAYNGHANLFLFALTLIGAVAIHAGTNLINDYYDYRKGADTEKSLGQGGAIQKKQLTPRQVFWGGIAAFTLGSAIGLYLVSVSGPFILILGLFSVLAGFFYTAGPAALAYIGLGEITVFVFMGPIMVIGAYYVQTQTVTWPVLLASLPVGCLVAAILHANNLRDLEGDRQIGKRTLATILGRQRANVEYYVLIGGAYVTLALTVILGLSPWYTIVTAITLPVALALMRRVAVNADPTTLNPVLRKTAQLHMRFGLLLAAGWVIALFVNQVTGH
ncbi:MAG: 1,4-dihydroxy-2-naphthoate octaprenyltransferase [Aggregatilineales bacterium]